MLKEINTFSFYFIIFIPIKLMPLIYIYISFSNLSAKQFNMLHFILIRLHRKYVKERKTIENIINLNIRLMVV